MQFLFYPHALLIALISRTAQYTDTVSCGNVQPKAVCTRKCADVLWSGLRVQDSGMQYSACPLFLTPGRGLPVRPENISRICCGRLLFYSSTVRQVLPSCFTSAAQFAIIILHAPGFGRCSILKPFRALPLLVLFSPETGSFYAPPAYNRVLCKKR